MSRWIYALGLCGALAPTLSQAASPVGVAPLNLQTATVRVTSPPLPDERSRALSFLEASQLRGRVLPFVIGVAAIDLALASFYWGVYVPHYAETAPAF